MKLTEALRGRPILCVASAREAARTPASPFGPISALLLLLLLVLPQVAVYGITGDSSVLNPEFSRLRQQMLQRRSEEALDAAAAARVLQAHAAAAAADAGGAGDRKGGAAHERDDDDRVSTERVSLKRLIFWQHLRQRPSVFLVEMLMPCTAGRGKGGADGSAGIELRVARRRRKAP